MQPNTMTKQQLVDYLVNCSIPTKNGKGRFSRTRQFLNKRTIDELRELAQRCLKVDQDHTARRTPPADRIF